jgi:hypothetical protein
MELPFRAVKAREPSDRGYARRVSRAA